MASPVELWEDLQHPNDNMEYIYICPKLHHKQLQTNSFQYHICKFVHYIIIVTYSFQQFIDKL